MITKSMNAIELELEEKFHNRIIQNERLAESYERLGYEKKAKTVSSCGTELDWLKPNDPTIPHKLIKANFCKDRLCPMCGWRRTKKIFGQVSKIMDKLDEEYEFVFVTLTVRNCSSAQLPDWVHTLFEAFDLFNHYKEVRQAFKGYFRALEITRHKHRIRSVEWHPHFHVIYAVKPSYFTSRYYVKHADLIRLWAQAVRLNYDPSVRIEKVKPKEGKKRYTEKNHDDALHEVAKYATKSFDYLTNDTVDTDTGVFTLMKSLRAHRLCGLGGVFRKVAQEMKLDDMTDGDLVNTDNEELREDIAGMIYRYNWRAGWGYAQTSVEDYQEYKARQKAAAAEETAFYENIKARVRK